MEASREARTHARFHKLAETRPDLVAVTKFRYGWNTPGCYSKPLGAGHLHDVGYLSLLPFPQKTNS